MNNILNVVKKNRKGIFFMILSSLCVCTGQLSWKLFYDYGIVLLLGGFALYGIGAILMVYSFRFGKLSVLQPVLSFNYIITLFLAHFVLDEKIEFLQIIGVFAIVLGLFLISGSDH